MTYREKVIKGLEYHLKELSVGKTCYECPYFGDNPCEIELIANALELLKDQEPTRVSQQWDDTHGASYCECGSSWISINGSRINYCPSCGKAVKWDD